MATELKPRVIAIEEHYLDTVVDDALGGRGSGGGMVRDRLADIDGNRIKEMDEAGIDVQVLFHCPPVRRSSNPTRPAGLRAVWCTG